MLIKKLYYVRFGGHNGDYEYEEYHHMGYVVCCVVNFIDVFEEYIAYSLKC
jgi:hypothetical protein